MSEKKKTSSALRDAASSLTIDNWHKGDYFATRSGKLCMCVHGAVQAQVNQPVKLVVWGENGAGDRHKVATDATRAALAARAAGAANAAALDAGAANAAALDADAVGAARVAHADAPPPAAARAALAANAAALADHAAGPANAAALAARAARALAASASAASAAASAAASGAALAAHAGDSGVARLAAHAAHAGGDAVVMSLAKVYGQRPVWVMGSPCGLDAHYIMGLVGLTSAFNDNRNTTLADVLLKLEVAATLADELCT